MVKAKALGCKVLWFLTPHSCPWGLVPWPGVGLQGPALSPALFRAQQKGLAGPGHTAHAPFSSQPSPKTSLSPGPWDVPHKPWRFLSKLLAHTTELSTPGVLRPPPTRRCGHQNEDCVTLAQCHNPWAGTGSGPWGPWVGAFTSSACMVADKGIDAWRSPVPWLVCAFSLSLPDVCHKTPPWSWNSEHPAPSAGLGNTKVILSSLLTPLLHLTRCPWPAGSISSSRLWCLGCIITQLSLRLRFPWLPGPILCPPMLNFSSTPYKAGHTLRLWWNALTPSWSSKPLCLLQTQLQRYLY